MIYLILLILVFILTAYVRGRVDGERERDHVGVVEAHTIHNQGFREGQQFERERILRVLNPHDRRLQRSLLTYFLAEDDHDQLDQVHS